MQDTINLLEEELLKVKSDIKVNEENIKLQKQYLDTLGKLNAVSTSLQQDLGYLNKSQKVLKKYKVDYKNKGSAFITEAINEAIATIFPERDYKFKFDTKLRGKYSYTNLLYQINNSDILRIVKHCSGLGVRETIGFISLVCILALSNVTPVVFLDECFANMSQDTASKLSEILDFLVSIGFLFITIEHTDGIYEKCDTTVFELGGNSKEGTKLINKYIVPSKNREEE